MKLHKINGIDVFVQESENCVQINDIDGLALLEIWEPLRNIFPGYELVLCFHDVPPLDALKSMNAELLEDCLDMRVYSHKFVPHNSTAVAPLSKNNFASFAALHNNVNPECGATSQLICNKWDNWRVFTINNNEIIGYAIIGLAMRDENMGEVYAVWANSHTQHMSLLSAVTQCAFENSKKKVVYMIDRDNATALKSALALGYKEVGFYIGYRIKSI